MKRRSKILTLILTLSFIIAICAAVGISANAAESTLPTADTAGETVDVWLIGGQSNAVGFGKNYPTDSAYSEDKKILDAGVSNVWYFAKGEGAQYHGSQFVPVKLGLGLDTQSSGAEIGIATALAENSNQMNAVIKFSIGATFLYPDVTNSASQNHGTWTSPSYIEKHGISTAGNKIGNMYDNFIETVAEGLAQIKEAGYTPRIRGMWWMQGEAETWSNEMASAYSELLTTLIGDVRADLTELSGTSCLDMPFVYGRVYAKEGTHTGPATLAAVQAAQDSVANNTSLKNVFMVNFGTDLKDPASGAAALPVQQDTWHFDALTQQMIGEAFISKATIANTEYTPYGLITYNDTTKAYPFAVFFEKNDGTVMFHSLYNSYVDAVDNARWKITVNRIAPVIAESDVKQAIIYQRSDYTSSGFPTQLANLHFPITVDLNGKTLTAPTLMNTDHNSASNADREITYKNGTILTSSSWGVIYMQVNNGTPAVDMTLTVNFENINFGFATGSNTKVMFAVDWQGVRTQVNTKLDINCKSCTVDLVTNRGSNFKGISEFSTTTEGDTYKDVTLTLEGCDIKINSTSDLACLSMQEGDAMYFKADDEGSFGSLLLKNAPADGVSFDALLTDSATKVTPVSTGTTEGDFTVYSLTQSAGVTIPGYGTITDKYADANAYPFAVFVEKTDGTVSFHSAYSTYVDAMEAARWRIYVNKWAPVVAQADIKSMTVYMRRDYSQPSTESWPVQVSNKSYDITIDLGGNTLNARTLMNTNNLSASKIDSTIYVKNGTVLNSTHAFVYIQVQSGFATENQTTTVNFENVTLRFAENTGSAISLVMVGQRSSDVSANAKFNLNYKNCTIDLVTNRPASFRAIANTSVNDVNSLEDVTLTFEGCKFIAESITDISYIENKTEGDNVIFSETDTNKLLMSPSSATPDYSNVFVGSKGANILCVETTDSEDSYKVYSLEAGVETKYGPVPANLASNSKYPFLLFSVNNAGDIVFHSAADIYYNAIYYSRMYGEQLSAKEMIVLMTADFYQSRGDVQQLALSKCDITVDLDQHTLTTGSLMRTWGGQYSRSGVSVTYKNGTILTRGWALIDTHTYSGSPENCVMNINFENATLGFAKDSNSGALLLRVEGRDTNAGNAIFNITYKDCVIDYVTNHSTATNAVLAETSYSATDTKDDIKMVFEGCDIILPSISDLNMKYFNEGDEILFKNCLVNETRILTSAEATSSDLAFKAYEGYNLTLKAQDSADGYYVYKLASKAIEEVSSFVPKASVTLDSNLIFNIYIPVYEGLTGATLNGVALELTDPKDGYYLVSTELPSAEAAKELVLKVTLTSDSTPLTGTFTFSTVKYAQKLLSMDDISDAEKTLAKDMLSYIRSAYNYFDGKNGIVVENKAEVIASIDEILNGYNKTELGEVTVPSAGGDRTILKGVTLVLGATPAIRFYLPAGADISDYTFSIGSSVLEYETKVETAAGDFNGLTCVDISLYAYRMVDEITITNGEASMNYHINYYYQGVDKNDTALIDIVTKFYNYCVSAKNYRDSVIGK